MRRCCVVCLKRLVGKGCSDQHFDSILGLVPVHSNFDPLGFRDCDSEWNGHLSRVLGAGNSRCSKGFTDLLREESKEASWLNKLLHSMVEIQHIFKTGADDFRIVLVKLSTRHLKGLSVPSRCYCCFWMMSTQSFFLKNKHWPGINHLLKLNFGS